MRQQTLVYCSISGVSLYRKDGDGRGIWHKCRGCHSEHLKTWAEMDIPRSEVEQLLKDFQRLEGSTK
jgi:hypothetical protein